ncbi:hypothetical protein TGAM01_v210859 [Trichoderma gamsii]|uniref:Protein kinase domain-containing protein n=1 Tax=Trichoderma gamsii TaxID=398673 RepID=A0A2P4Z7J6_9HYPO|nr:hypothetical protein TGAM01_v210859 [Trichoderma gamsii]PON20263.1 hypothetical protein TGAM01_v210859 [Trichoderma gamsii]
MSDETLQVQLAPPKPLVDFAFFSADNEAAIHLLDLVKAETSLPTLISNKETIGFQLSTISSSHDSSLKDFWLIGAGPSHATPDKNSHHGKPDILLCPPGESRSANIARQYIEDLHAGLSFHAESNVMTLTSYSMQPIIYEEGDMGNEDLKLCLLGRRSCVMRHRRNVLWIGQYRFILEFIAQGQDKEAKIEPHGYRGLYPSPSAYPAACSMASWNVWLQGCIPETSVISGVDIYTGDPIAVKKLGPDIALRTDTYSRLQVASQYGKSLEKGVLGIVDMCFANVQWSKLYENRCRLCYQTLLGLAELHQKDISHGNIHPESLLIFTKLESMSVNAVISLDMQPRENLNTSICVAPEVWKKGASLDKEKLDIWGLAASWLFAFFQVPEGQKMDQQLHVVMTATIESGVRKGWYEKPFAHLLRKMLAFNPEDRPSATTALAYEAWQPIEEASKRKRKREDTKSKKVRFVKQAAVCSF